MKFALIVTTLLIGISSSSYAQTYGPVEKKHKNTSVEKNTTPTTETGKKVSKTNLQESRKKKTTTQPDPSEIQSRRAAILRKTKEEKKAAQKEKEALKKKLNDQGDSYKKELEKSKSRLNDN